MPKKMTARTCELKAGRRMRRAVTAEVTTDPRLVEGDLENY